MEENEKEESVAKKRIVRALDQAADGAAQAAGAAAVGGAIAGAGAMIKKAAANRAAQEATKMTATELVRTKAPQAIMAAMRYVILRRP